MGHDDKSREIQSDGRHANAAQPLNDAPDHGGPERYPSTNRDDSIAPDGGGDTAADRNPRPPQGAGDGGPASTNDGRLGPGADPVEGKR